MLGEWLPVPRRVRLVFLAVMLLLAATLGWLGWRLLAQDQQLAAQRLAERRDTAADLIVAALEKRLLEVEQDLDRVLADGAPVNPPSSSDTATVMMFRSGSLRTWPEQGLIYQPELPGPREAADDIFAAADALEFRARDHLGAIAALHQPANSGDPTVRAAALVRVARNQLKAGRLSDAQRSYTALAHLPSVSVGGLPAAAAASVGSLALLERQGDRVALVETARSLLRDVHAGRWPMSFATYQYVAAEAARWLPEVERTPPRQIALAEAATWLWERRARDAPSLLAGRASLAMPAGSVLMLWRASGGDVAALIAAADHLERTWVANLQPLLAARGVRLSLTHPDGRSFLGPQDDVGGRPAIRLASATGLPWTVQVLDAGGVDEAFIARRRLLLASMGVLVALILIGGWVVGRSVGRELAVADLQRDFVSAVSHEFRTPLTTLCQLSELLVRDRVAGEQDRRHYYALLHKESERLRRLVEALLTFGRLEAGTMPLRFEDVDASALVRQSVAEFAESGQASGHRFDVESNGDGPVVRADRETLRCVLWNLFENAAKYSPASDTVWVEVSKDGTHTRIAVRDRGVGIPRSEHRRIFEKFVRGSAARASDIRGTGIGLAIARQIVRAHGGDITVDSEPGRGSTFSVLLPISPVSQKA